MKSTSINYRGIQFSKHLDFSTIIVYIRKYLLHVINNITFGITAPDYPIITVEITFLGYYTYEICLLLVVNNNNNLSHVCLQSYSESAYPITPV